MKKAFEILVVLYLLYVIVYFVSYIFFLDDYCDKKSQDVRNHKDMNLFVLKECRESFVCEYDYDTDIHKAWKLVKYDCEKKKVKYFEKKYYLDLIDNLWKKK